VLVGVSSVLLLLRERFTPSGVFAKLPESLLYPVPFDSVLIRGSVFSGCPPITFFLLLAFFSSSLIKKRRSSSSSSSIISSMLTSLSTFRFTFTTLLFTVFVPEPMLLIRLDRGEHVELTLTPSFFNIVFTLLVLMLIPPAVVVDPGVLSFCRMELVSRFSLADLLGFDGVMVGVGVGGGGADDVVVVVVVTTGSDTDSATVGVSGWG
jgi:hypothetical protein